MALRALDTNGYVELLRGGPRATAIRTALVAQGTELVVLMAVMAELQFGARNAAEGKAIAKRLLDPVAMPRRIAARPDEWLATGSMVAALRRSGFDEDELKRRGFFLDVHIAHVCRSRGIILWTDDQDHARLREVIHHATEPLPQ